VVASVYTGGIALPPYTCGIALLWIQVPSASLLYKGALGLCLMGSELFPPISPTSLLPV